jgi:hypothetical protein
MPGAAARDRMPTSVRTTRARGLGGGYELVPVYMESFVRLGVPAYALLCRVADMAANGGGIFKTAFIKCALQERSVTCAKGMCACCVRPFRGSLTPVAARICGDCECLWRARIGNECVCLPVSPIQMARLVLRFKQAGNSTRKRGNITALLMAVAISKLLCAPDSIAGTQRRCSSPCDADRLAAVAPYASSSS